MEAFIAISFISVKMKLPLRNEFTWNSRRSLSYSQGKGRDGRKWGYSKLLFDNTSKTMRFWNWKHTVPVCNGVIVPCLFLKVLKLLSHLMKTSISLFTFLGPVWILNSHLGLDFSSFLTQISMYLPESVFPAISLWDSHLAWPIHVASQFTLGVSKVMSGHLHSAHLVCISGTFPQITHKPCLFLTLNRLCHRPAQALKLPSMDAPTMSHSFIDERNQNRPKQIKLSLSDHEWDLPCLSWSVISHVENLFLIDLHFNLKRKKFSLGLLSKYCSWNYIHVSLV